MYQIIRQINVDKRLRFRSSFNGIFTLIISKQIKNEYDCSILIEPLLLAEEIGQILGGN